MARDRLEFDRWPQRDTLQEWEDLIPTRSDHQLDSSSTCHGLDGRDRPGQKKMSFRDPGFTNCEGLMQIIKPESKRKVLLAEESLKTEKSPEVDKKTGCIHHLLLLLLLQNPQCARESHEHERLAQYRVGKRQSQEV